MASMADDYTGRLLVAINGAATPSQESTITVNKQDNGKYTLELNNFILGGSLGVGNIRLADVEATVSGSNVKLSTTQNIEITPGTDPDFGKDEWLGPNLGQIPVSVNATLGELNALAATIDIPFALMNMNIKVVFDSNAFQIGNSDFENFHTAKLYQPTEDGSEWDYTTEPTVSDEPNCWHSFMSASGTKGLVYMAGYTPHTFISDETRPGSTGKKSVKLTSADMGFFGIANGTMTTGRINTGHYIAADPSNHSWSSLEETDKDANGDPFYSLLGGKPDGITVWAKFKQGTPNEEFPYATIRAVITDGTYYQDPEDKEYTNILATATNATIESKNFEWQELNIPFIYNDVDDSINGKLIHVTISTNAEPGKGSSDELYIDDFALVYNCNLTGLTIKGTTVDVNGGTYDEANNITTINSDALKGNNVTENDIDITTDGKGAIVVKNVSQEGNNVVVVITVISNDLNSYNTYKVVLNGAATGIENVENGTVDNSVKEIYNISGQKMTMPIKGQINIIRKADGKTVKVIK